MKRHGNLWKDIVSFDNLLCAYDKTVYGKRTKRSVCEFVFNMENELISLENELLNKTYHPGGYVTFHIYDPKKRLISAAAFRDRIVHHALCNVIEPIFDNTFICDLYSNRKGKGVHRAVKRAMSFAREHRYVLKCDIKTYFPSVDLAILKRLIRQKIKCPDTLWLTDMIIDCGNPQAEVMDYFPGDDLFTPVERRKGLPIGNQTSQFFSNLFLSPTDHYVKEVLKVKGYVRYVDDFLLFGESKSMIWEWRDAIERFLYDYRLTLKPNGGVALFHVSDGFPFLGYRVLPDSILINRKAILRFRRKAKALRRRRRNGEIGLKEIKQYVFGVMGHMGQANSDHFIYKLLNETRF